jgi:two-component system sensor histidine kinase RegB
MSDTPPLTPWDIAPASKRNMMLLIQLRWIAVVGQLLTIWFVAAVLHVHLPSSR